MSQHRLRGLLLALVFICTLVLAAPAGAADAETAAGAEVSALVAAVKKQRTKAWHWQKVMGTRRLPTKFMEEKTTDVAQLTFLREIWTKRAKRAHARAQQPPHRAAWLCIHRHEGRWTDPRAPYYGGLQMSIQFQRAYGRYLLRRKGTANRWTPEEQMWTAERAFRAGSGFHPWPNTARRCGLL